MKIREIISNNLIYLLALIPLLDNTFDFVYNDSVVLAFLIFAAIFVIKRICKDNREKRETIFLLSIVTVAASIPFINEFLYGGHDFPYHLTRIENIKDMLKAGQFPVRINYSNVGGPTGANPGHASPIMYPELFLYIPAILQIIGVSSLIAYKIFCFLINSGYAVLSYISLKSITRSRYVALIFSFFYTLCIYRLENMYLRFDLGESQAMVFIPLLILSLYEIFYRDEKKWWLLALVMTCILQSHIPTIFLITMAVTLFVAIHVTKLNPTRILSISKAAIVTVLVNLWFLVPFLTFLPVVHTPIEFKLWDSSAYLSQIFATFVTNSGGEGLLPAITRGHMPLSIGGVIVFGVITFIFVSFAKRTDKYPGLIKMGKYSLFFGLTALLLASSLFPWIRFQDTFLHRIQFSWRFLVLAIPALSIVASIGIYILLRLYKWKKEAIVYVSLFLSLAGSAYYIDSILKSEVMIPNKLYRHTYNFDAAGDYRYKDSDPVYSKKNVDKVVSSSESIVTQYQRNGKLITVQFSDNRGSNYLEIPVYNFPGYTAILNDSIPLELSNGENNFIRLSLPKDLEKGIIHIQYKESLYFLIADAVSLITLIVLIGFAILHFKRRTESAKRPA